MTVQSTDVPGTGRTASCGDAILASQSCRESAARTYSRSFPVVPARAEGMDRHRPDAITAVTATQVPAEQV